MFMRVNSTCAHQVRPPPGRIGSLGGRDNPTITTEKQLTAYSRGRRVLPFATQSKSPLEEERPMNHVLAIAFLVAGPLAATATNGVLIATH